MPNSYGFDYQGNQEDIDLATQLEREDEELKQAQAKIAQQELLAKQQDQAMLAEFVGSAGQYPIHSFRAQPSRQEFGVLLRLVSLLEAP